MPPSANAAKRTTPSPASASKPPPKLSLVHAGPAYPINEESEGRPFRLWNANARAPIRWRNYLHLRHAHVAALIECRFAAIGVCIEVFDTRNGKLSGQYIRRVHSVEFIGEPKR